MASNQPLSPITSYRPAKKLQNRKTKTPYNRPAKTKKTKTNTNPNINYYSMEKPYFATKKRRFSHYNEENGSPMRIKFLGYIKNPIIQQYFNDKIIKNNEENKLCNAPDGICNAPDGIYTWIRTTENDIYATQIESNQEIGTLHDNLIYFITKRDPGVKINVCGEIEITTKNDGKKEISFNFQSGTFFKKILPLLRRKYRNETDQQIQERLSVEIKGRLSELCPNSIITDKLDEDFIEYTKFKSKEETIKRYKNMYNNTIELEPNIGIEKGKNNNGHNMNVKFRHEVNLRKNPYFRNEINKKNNNKSLEGGKYTYKNKKYRNHTYKRYRNKK